MATFVVPRARSVSRKLSGSVSPVSIEDAKNFGLSPSQLISPAVSPSSFTKATKETLHIRTDSVHSRHMQQDEFEKFPEYNEDGIRLNITARMMAVQAPQNWTEAESDAFFTRHYYRSLLQKVFLDRGVVQLLKSEDPSMEENTEPVIIGSLRKSCYVSFVSYVRGAMEKLSRDPERAEHVLAKMGDITNEEIATYAKRYDPLKKELSITWSLMAFSAGVVESLIVVDRWLYLKEQKDLVKDAWVEAVFDYELSPRNLVVVGIKR